MIKIYSYYVHLKTLPEFAFQQLRLSSRYYNTLIELENKRRAEFRALRTRMFPELAALETRQEDIKSQIDALEIQKKRENAAARTKVKNIDLIDQLKALKAERKEANAKVKTARAEAKPLICPRADDSEKKRTLTKPELELLPSSASRDFSLACIDIDASDLERCKQARAQSGLYWTTYLRIEKAVQQASKTAKTDPRFKRFTGEGCLGGQIQNGLSIEKVYGCEDTRLRIAPLPPNSWDSRKQYRKAYTTAHLRIGSDEHSKPIWLELPILLDRPLPTNALIKEAYLKVIKLGLRSRYELKLTIDSPEFDCLRPNKREIIKGINPMPPTSGVCAINFGWRSMDNGNVRVAYLVDNTGHQETIELPAGTKDGFTLVERLQGFCDEHFDTAKAQLIKFIENAKELPEWIPEVTKTIAQWKSHSRLSYIATKLRDEVIGSEHAQVLWEIYAHKNPPHGTLPSYESITSYLFEASELVKIAWYLEVWRKKDKHLVEYLSNLRQKCQDQRKDLYRVTAKKIAARYNVVLIDDTNFSRMRRKSEIGSDDGPNSEELKASAEASPGELRSTIIEKVGEHRIFTRPAQFKTVTCHLCKQNHDWNTKDKYLQSCPVHQREVDQDWNNCMNLLSEYNSIMGNNPREVRRIASPGTYSQLQISQ